MATDIAKMWGVSRATVYRYPVRCIQVSRQVGNPVCGQIVATEGKSRLSPPPKRS